MWVTLSRDRALSFEVRDDGAGFVPPRFPAKGGMRNVRDRIETVGGRLTVDSAPGRGTRVRGVVPRPTGITRIGGVRPGAPGSMLLG